MCTYGHLYMSMWVELPKQRWSLQSRAAGRKTDIIMELFDMHTDMLSLTHTHTHTHTHTDRSTWHSIMMSSLYLPGGCRRSLASETHYSREIEEPEAIISPLQHTALLSSCRDTEKHCVCVCVRINVHEFVCVRGEKESVFWSVLSKIYPTEILMWLQQTHVEKKAMYYLKIASFMWRSPLFMREKNTCVSFNSGFPL